MMAITFTTCGWRRRLLLLMSLAATVDVPLLFLTASPVMRKACRTKS
jgi:hypothetical protein